MEITVNINAIEIVAAINKLAEAIERGGTTALAPVPKAEPKAKTEPKAAPATKVNTEPKAIPKEEPKAEPAPKEEQPKPEPKAAPKEEPTYTLVQVREKLAALSRSGKQAQVKALIEKFGAAKLSDIKEEDYAALMAEAEGL